MYKKPKKKIAREREVKRERYSDLPRKCGKKKKKPQRSYLFCKFLILL